MTNSKKKSIFISSKDTKKKDPTLQYTDNQGLL